MEQRFESSGKETTKIGRRYGDAIGGFAGSVVCPSSSFSALEGDFSFNGAAEPDSFDSLFTTGGGNFKPSDAFFEI
jgi:hypothetical protein